MTDDEPPVTVAVITADMCTDNDDATDGRLPILGDCTLCGDGHRRPLGGLTPGRWVVEHAHGCGYQARRLALR